MALERSLPFSDDPMVKLPVAARRPVPGGPLRARYDPPFLHHGAGRNLNPRLAGEARIAA